MSSSYKLSPQSTTPIDRTRKHRAPPLYAVRRVKLRNPASHEINTMGPTVAPQQAPESAGMTVETGEYGNKQQKSVARTGPCTGIKG